MITCPRCGFSFELRADFDTHPCDAMRGASAIFEEMIAELRASLASAEREALRDARKGCKVELIEMCESFVNEDGKILWSELKPELERL